MKKTLIIVAFATFIFTSCKKDYNCSCDSITEFDLNGTTTTTTTNSSIVINATSSDAVTQCDALDEAEEEVGLYTYSKVCSIK